MDYFPQIYTILTPALLVIFIVAIVYLNRRFK